VIISVCRAQSARRRDNERDMGIFGIALHPHRHRAGSPNRVNRRALMFAFAIAALLPATAWAQPFPNKPIKLILPFAAGGAADLFGRSLASGLGAELGQQIVVETRPGAGGLTGVDAVAKSAPDGYTICLAGAAALSAIPFMVSKMPFDWQKDLALLTLVVRVPEVLTVHPSLGVDTF
jgi:tripartite-type tricarboxylate transporter receptor subunit TctC